MRNAELALDWRYKFSWKSEEDERADRNFTNVVGNKRLSSTRERLADEII